MGDRRKTRADWDDYNEGIYFVTACCKDKIHFFGEIENGKMNLSDVGKTLVQRIADTESIHSKCEVLNSVVMPNHFHMVVALQPLEALERHGAMGCLRNPSHRAPCNNMHHNSRLSVVINHIKGHITKYAKGKGIDFGWQERYYDIIIRKSEAFDNIMEYINHNIENWHKDKLQ